MGRARAGADTPIRVGLVASVGPLTTSIRRGAEFGQSEADLFARLFGRRVELLVRSPAAEEGSLAAGLELVRSEGVAALIGGATDAAAEALVKAARQAPTVFLNVGSLSGRLRGPLFDRRTFHVHPSTATLVNAAGLGLIQKGGRTPWGIVVAESPFGSEVEAAAAALAAGVSARVVVRERLPSSFNDWPALYQRLRDAQPNALLAGLHPEAMRGFLNGYRGAGLSCPLASVASDPHYALEADPAGLEGAWPLTWHQSLERYSARELNSRFSRGFQQPLDPAGWAAWAAVKLVVEAAVRANSVELEPLLDFLESRLAFDGHKGAGLSFRPADHELSQPLYIARPRPGTAPGTAEALEVVGEVSQESLDAVAAPRQERE